MATYWNHGNESLGDMSPGSGGFSRESQRATMVYHLAPEDVSSAVEEALGTCEPMGDGRLDRSLPLTHPRWPWMFATSVDVQDIGHADADGTTASLVNANTELEAPPIADQYWSYVRSRARVEFTPRPYAVLGNDSIVVSQTNYRNDSNTLISNVNTANEWVRFTTIRYEPGGEFSYAQHGQMSFYTDSGNTPHNTPFSSFPRVLVPKSPVLMNWYEVPYQYLLSDKSKYVEWIGRINQLEWYGWEAGALLYMGVKLLRDPYTPPVPEFEVIGGLPSPSTFKLVDLQFIFIETVREAGAVYTPNNLSWIAAHHNLQPFLGVGGTGRGFYYAGAASNTASERTPLHLSCPFQVFFTDPDTLPDGI